jgi:hypothetical protein
LQPVLAAKRDGRRIIDDAIARLDPLQRRGLAVTDLHETFIAAAPDVFGRSDRDPIRGHRVGSFVDPLEESAARLFRHARPCAGHPDP